MLLKKFFDFVGLKITNAASLRARFIGRGGISLAAFPRAYCVGQVFRLCQGFVVSWGPFIRSRPKYHKGFTRRKRWIKHFTV